MCDFGSPLAFAFTIFAVLLDSLFIKLCNNIMLVDNGDHTSS